MRGKKFKKLLPRDSLFSTNSPRKKPTKVNRGKELEIHTFDINRENMKIAGGEMLEQYFIHRNQVNLDSTSDLLTLVVSPALGLLNCLVSEGLDECIKYRRRHLYEGCLALSSMCHPNREQGVSRTDGAQLSSLRRVRLDKDTLGTCTVKQVGVGKEYRICGTYIEISNTCGWNTLDCKPSIYDTVLTPRRKGRAKVLPPIGGSKKIKKVVGMLGDESPLALG
jgi:hypothetical protein